MLSRRGNTVRDVDGFDGLATALVDVLGAAGCSWDMLSRIAYTQAVAGAPEGVSPWAVAWPSSTNQLASLIAALSEFKARWIVRGGGSSAQLAAQSFRQRNHELEDWAGLGAPLVVITTEALGLIEEPDLVTRSVRVGAGVTFQQLTETLKEAGARCAWNVDVPETMTVGGAVASRRPPHVSALTTLFGPGAGLRTSFLDHVYSIRGVTHDGRVVTARSDVAESGLFSPLVLMAESAATDFVISEVEIEISWQPFSEALSWFAYPTLNAALDAVDDAVAANQTTDAATATLISPNASNYLDFADEVPSLPAQQRWLLRVAETTRDDDGLGLVGQSEKSATAFSRLGAQLKAEGTSVTGRETPVLLDRRFVGQVARLAARYPDARIALLDAQIPVDHLTRIWRDFDAIEEAYSCAIASILSPLTGHVRLALLPLSTSEQGHETPAEPFTLNDATSEVCAAIEAREGYVQFQSHTIVRGGRDSDGDTDNAIARGISAALTAGGRSA